MKGKKNFAEPDASGWSRSRPISLAAVQNGVRWSTRLNVSFQLFGSAVPRPQRRPASRPSERMHPVGGPYHVQIFNRAVLQRLPTTALG